MNPQKISLSTLMAYFPEIARSPVWRNADGLYAAPCCMPTTWLRLLADHIGLPIKPTPTNNTVEVRLFYGKDDWSILSKVYAVYVSRQKLSHVAGHLHFTDYTIEPDIN